MADDGGGGPVRAAVRLRLPDHIRADLSPSQREDAEVFIQVLERRLWAWESFPIRLPPTVFDAGSSRVVDVKDLFQAPTSEEVRELGVSDGGRGPRLVAGQLEGIRERAVFEVPSRRYPGLSHVWQVGPVLQKGQAAIREAWRVRLARAAGQLLRIPDRLWGDGLFSCLRAARNLRTALEAAPGLLIGAREEHPAYSPADIERRVERSRVDSLREAQEAGRLTCDLTLLDEKLMKKAVPLAEFSQRRAEAEWPALEPGARAEAAALARAGGLSGPELAQEVEDRVAQRRNDGFFCALRKSVPLQELSPGLGAKLADRGRARLELLEARRRFEEGISIFSAEIRERLAREHGILARTRWLDRRVAEAASAERERRSASFEDGLPGLLESAGLAGEAESLRRELEFSRTSGRDLGARLEAERAPNRVFQLIRFIWRPSRWKIEKVPETDPPRYVLIRHEAIRVPTSVPGWRLANTAVRFWTWTSNAMFGLMAFNLLNGPLGLKALFLAEPFPYDWTVDQDTGRLVRHAARFNTLSSRLRGLLRQRRRILDDFEARGEYGLLGKDFKRLMLVIPVDVILGVLAPLALAIGQPAATLVNAAVSVALAATAWVWAPAVSVLWWALNALVYDSEGTMHPRAGMLIPRRLFPALHLFFDLAVGGLGLAALSLAGAAAHALLAAAAAAWAATAFAARQGWDWAMMGLIAWRGRVPAGDERYLVRRIGGPGLTAEHFFQVSPELVLVAMQAALEAEGLELYARRTEHRIRAPRAAYEEVLGAFRVVSGAPQGFDEKAGVFAFVGQREEALLKELSAAVAPRRELYARLLAIPNQSRIKLSDSAYGPTLRKAVLLAKSFYTRFAREQGVGAPGDWGATAQRVLSGAFGPEILVPLEAADRSLKIEVSAPGLADYAAGIEAGLLPEDLGSISLTGLGRHKPPAAPKPRVLRADARLALSASTLGALSGR